MRNVDLLIIGGGAAGMAAAVSAKKQGIENILIIERNGYLGGVLRQCIHNGFGLHRFKEDLTGVEFAAKYRDMVEELNIPYLLNTFVIEMTSEKVVTMVNPDEGLIQIKAEAIILAMGCRERTRNALLIPGTRGAGIITAGTAQKYLNVNGYIPGKKVVIVGSGDIGLIMARQFIMEGVSVEAVVEIMPFSGGLPRNMKQCIEDFDIPVYYNSIISEIRGKERVSSVVIAKADENRKPIKETEFEIECDTLMISAGLIPENELTEQAGIIMSKETKGAVVMEDNQTSLSGVFSCGNVLHVHDLVDFVSEEAEETGIYAAEYLKRSKDAVHSNENKIRIISGKGVSGVVPQLVNREPKTEYVSFMFRPRGKYQDVWFSVTSDEKLLYSKKAFALTPGEMCRLDIPAGTVKKAGESIRIDITEEKPVSSDDGEVQR